jgi:hypothetical protein
LCRDSLTGYGWVPAVSLYAALVVNTACCLLLLALCRRYVTWPWRHARWVLSDSAVVLYESAMWASTLFMLGYLWWTLGAGESLYVLTATLTVSAVLSSASTSYTAPVDLLGSGYALSGSLQGSAFSSAPHPVLSVAGRDSLASSGSSGGGGGHYQQHQPWQARRGLGEEDDSDDDDNDDDDYYYGDENGRYGGEREDSAVCVDDEEGLVSVSELHERRQRRLLPSLRLLLLAVAVHNLSFAAYKVLEIAGRIEAAQGEGQTYAYRLSVVTTLAGLWYRAFLTRYFYRKFVMPHCNVLCSRFERAVKTGMGFA